MFTEVLLAGPIVGGLYQPTQAPVLTSPPLTLAVLPRTCLQTCSPSWKLCSHCSTRTDPVKLQLPGAMRPHDALHGWSSSGNRVRSWTTGGGGDELPLVWAWSCAGHAGVLRLYINKSSCPSMCHRVAVRTAAARYRMGCSIPGSLHWLWDQVWEQERIPKLLNSCSAHRPAAGISPGSGVGTSIAWLGCRGCGLLLGQAGPHLGKPLWGGRGGMGVTSTADPALELGVS